MTTHLKLWQRFASLLILALIASSVVPTFAAGQRRRARRPTVRYYTVPADTVIRVRMNQSLNSKTANVGDRFSATVTDPVHSGGTEVIADGAKIWGRVTAVKRAGRRSPGTITVSFYSMTQPNGRANPINGSLASLDGDESADNEGTVKGSGQRKRDVVFIGGGAATGALIGAIAGGGKGAAIGAILGGAAGTGARVYEKEKEAEVKSGTEFGVILNRSVSLPATSVR